MSMISKIKYAAGEIAQNWDDPWWVRMRFQDHVIGRIQRARYEGGIDVMEEDWDILLVIDACRHDLFENTVLDGDTFDDYQVKKSKASATMEWMDLNFSDGEWGDTVYISANPWITKKAPDSFHHIENLWVTNRDLTTRELDKSQTLKQAGVDTGETISATETTNIALEIAGEYPNKRLIVHYLQPHAPYIGNPDGTEKSDDEIDPHLHPGRPHWEGTIDSQECWEEYKNNLEYVMYHVWRLLDEVEGKAVVTSDHGEMFGERIDPFLMRGYDHPLGLRTPELVNVPWAVLDRERRTIKDDGVNCHSISEGQMEEVNDRLRNLGYAEEV